MTRVSGVLRSWVAFLCLGTGATVAYHLVRDPYFQAVVAIGLVAAALAALIAGIRAHRPEPRLPWILLAASQAAAIGSWVLWEHTLLSTGDSPSPGSPQDVFWIASNVLLLATASFFLARRRAGIAGYLDAGILAAAFALAAWLFVFGERFGDSRLTELSTATPLSYGLLDALLLAVLLRGTPALRSAPAVLVPAGIVAILVTDSLYNWLAVTGAYEPGAWADLGWLLSPVLLGAAALHPSMATLFRRRTDRGEARLARPFVALLGLAALGAPSVMAVELVSGRETDSYVTFACATLLSLFVVARLALLIRRSERLDARARHLATIVESSSDAIISMDLRARITSWNAAASRMYGYEPHEVLGRPITILVPPERSEDPDLLVARLAGGEQIESYETVSMAKDGRRVEISLGVSAIRNARGELIGFSTIARDVTERSRVEAERRRLAAIVEASSDAIIGTEIDGRVVSWNAAAEAVSGWHASEIVGRNVANVIVPDRRDDLPEILARLQRGEPVINFDTQLACKGGGTAEISLSVALVRDDNGVPTGISAVARDVTAVKEAEARVREAEERYRVLVEQLPVITYIDVPTEEGGELWAPLYVSPQLEESLGWTRDEWMSRTDFYYDTMVHPEDREWVVAAHERAYASDSGHNIEHRLLHRDGSTRWFADHMVIARDDEGRPLWSQGYLLDITERKSSEERVRLAEARYRSLVEQLPLVVYIDALDEESSAIYMSPQIEPMLGYTVDEWLSDRELFRKVLHPDDRERVMAELQRANRAKEAWRCEYRLVARDGRIVWIHDEDMVVRGEDGSPLYSQGFMLDITSRVAAERELERLLAAERAHVEELRELDGLKDEFVALVSHELRTPLTSIRGYLELVLDGDAGSLTDEQERFLRVVERNAMRLQGLVGDLLFIAQVEAGRLAVELAPVDVEALVAEAVEAARPAASEKELELEVVAEPGDLRLLEGDRVRLGQLLDNLVSNAVKFTPAGGRVTVSASAGDGKLELAVADTGIGIPKDEQAQLFQRFFRSSTATEQAIPGTGLGLTIAKAIAEAHGGSIRCESAEGEGTRFVVELPTAAASLEDAA